MSNAAPTPQIPLILTQEFDCGYLPGNKARNQAVYPPAIVDTDAYGLLIKKGFRRSGVHIYRPACDTCDACKSLRIPVDGFTPSRTQRRVWKQHSNLRAIVRDPEFDDEHYALYQAYQQFRHTESDMNVDDPKAYKDFLLNSFIATALVEFRLGDELKMVCSIDVMPEVGLSAVYTYYADDVGASYGTYAILWQVHHARRMGLPHVYLGYWVDQSITMGYKTRFQPYEILHQGVWSRHSTS